MDGYSLLVYTTPVDTVFRTVSLATQTRLAFVIHLPAFLGILQARFASFLKKKKGTIWCWLSTGLVYTKTIIHLSVGEEW